MKLVVGRTYYTRRGTDSKETAKIVTEEEFRNIFGYDIPVDYAIHERPFIAVYGYGTEQRPLYARLHENGRGEQNDYNWYDLVRPKGNILNQ